MNERRITLQFDKSLYGLAGYDMGKETFIKQIKPYWNPDQETTIVFPKEIEIIASSFIQGMCDGIVEHIGIAGMQQKIHFDGNSVMGNLNELILQNLV